MNQQHAVKPYLFFPPEKKGGGGLLFYVRYFWLDYLYYSENLDEFEKTGLSWDIRSIFVKFALVTYQ